MLHGDVKKFTIFNIYTTFGLLWNASCNTYMFTSRLNIAKISKTEDTTGIDSFSSYKCICITLSLFLEYSTKY